MKIDWLSTLLVTLLTATLLAFFFGYFSYPYGWIVLTFVLVARLTGSVANSLPKLTYSVITNYLVRNLADS